MPWGRHRRYEEEDEYCPECGEPYSRYEGLSECVDCKTKGCENAGCSFDDKGARGRPLSPRTKHAGDSSA